MIYVISNFALVARSDIRSGQGGRSPFASIVGHPDAITGHRKRPFFVCKLVIFPIDNDSRPERGDILYAVNRSTVQSGLDFAIQYPSRPDIRAGFTGTNRKRSEMNLREES